jgi:hypothetical protein
MAEPRRPLGEGAAQEAPTAPHATPRASGGKRTGPERFWAHWPVRVAFVACLVVSGAAHCTVVPIEIPHGFELKDTEGEAAIPIDVLDQEDTPPPPPPPAPVPPPEEEKPVAPVATVVASHRDAGAPRDGGADAARPSDGGIDAPADAAGDAPTDGGGAGLDGAIALNDGGATGPRDPDGLGVAGAVQADVVLVRVIVNAEVIRTNPVGAHMGYLLRGIPQWDEFMSGTDLDPVRDTDWVMISGPSLINTTRDVVLVHYSAPEAAVDRAMDVVSGKYDRGGRYDAGVPGVRAALAHADGAERVILRPQPRLLAVVPTGVATKIARQLTGAKVSAHIRPGEALYIRLLNPHHPMPEIPESISELRLRVLPRADEGADVLLEGDTKDPATATQAAEDVKAIFKRHNDWLTASLTHNLFSHPEVTVEGSQIHVHIAASRDQIEAVVALVGEFLGVRAGGGPVVPPAVPSKRPSALPQ